MNKRRDKMADPDMQDEYDFSQGVRGKYAKRYAQGTNIVLLAPDVARIFPTADAVNACLRAVAGIIRQQKKLAGAK